ncbi:MAG TPA: hypothetical protein VEB21_06555, partial [Terriglobales bacterium]|nr:hypothetical protein [Terriglobales bacterium]
KENAREGYLCGGNVAPDGYLGNVDPCDSDSTADPLLVDPDGADNVLGGAGYADDDFHLMDGSPAIDISPCSEDDQPLGTTDPAGALDLCPIDAGYHYPLPSNRDSVRAYPLPTSRDSVRAYPLPTSRDSVRAEEPEGRLEAQVAWASRRGLAAAPQPERICETCGSLAQ